MPDYSIAVAGFFVALAIAVALLIIGDAIDRRAR